MKNIIIAGSVGAVAGAVAGIFGHRAVVRRTDARISEELGLLPQHEVLGLMAKAEKARRLVDKAEARAEKDPENAELQEAASQARADAYGAYLEALAARKRCRSALPAWELEAARAEPAPLRNQRRKAPVVETPVVGETVAEAASETSELIAIEALVDEVLEAADGVPDALVKETVAAVVEAKTEGAAPEVTEAAQKAAERALGRRNKRAA